MNKKRTEHIYKLKGTILSRQLLQAPATSKYAGQEYYRLIIKLSEQTKNLSVFKNKLTNPSIWNTLQQAQHGEFSGKKYIFHCQNVRGYYHLVDWEELPSETKKEDQNELN